MDQFAGILQFHKERYPLMEPQDFGKLIYQSEFGPRHLGLSLGQIEKSLREEWAYLPHSPRREPEILSDNFCRIYLSSEEDPQLAIPVLACLLQMSMNTENGTLDGLRRRLDAACTLDIPGMKEWADNYRQTGTGLVRHSRRYNEIYKPHYRVIKKEFAQFYTFFLTIAERLAKKQPTVVAIDGRCGSGKTWLADAITCLFPCNLIHMDDFYLPKDCRSQDWQKQVGGNMNLSRFRQEVAEPLQAGLPVCYRAFCCQKQSYYEKTFDSYKLLIVVEGSYCLHPAAGLKPDISIFLTCSNTEQESRLRQREGDYFTVFANQWIPMADHYLQSCHIEKKAMLTFDTSMYAGHAEIQEGAI